VLLSDYQALNPLIGLTRSPLVTDQVTIDRPTSEADSGLRPPPGTAQSCPVDLGPSPIFTSASGPPPPLCSS
jgi:hypothetical protein